MSWRCCEAGKGYPTSRSLAGSRGGDSQRIETFGSRAPCSALAAYQGAVQARASQAPLNTRGSTSIVRRQAPHVMRAIWRLSIMAAQGRALSPARARRKSSRASSGSPVTCFCPQPSRLSAARSTKPPPFSLDTVKGDPVVDVRLGKETRRMLEEQGYSVTWRSYPLNHSVSPEELTDVAPWLRRVL
jgi:hypothetical protein